MVTQSEFVSGLIALSKQDNLVFTAAGEFRGHLPANGPRPKTPSGFMELLDRAR